MNIAVEALWLRLQPILAAFAGRLSAVDPTLAHNIGRSANDAFLLRAYLALGRRTGGDELAVTVDVQTKGQQLTLESDACTDDGRIVAIGPSVEISLSENQSNVEDTINIWVRDFERFLSESEPALVMAASHLS
jgi:hypothetical protein